MATISSISSGLRRSGVDDDEEVEAKGHTMKMRGTSFLESPGGVREKWKKDLEGRCHADRLDIVDDEFKYCIDL